MPGPASGPCEPYVTELELCCLVSGGYQDPCLTNGEPIPQTTVDLGLQAASELLWTMTGRQFGFCQVTIRPCRASCDPCGDGTGKYFDVTDFSYGSGFPWTPHYENGVWTNVKCECSGGCSCTSICEIPLPYPVSGVSEVLIDGAVIDPTTYRVDDFRNLVRTGIDEDGNGLCWPKCQDLTRPTTEPGTWSVTLTYGRPVPALVQQATASLACELIKSCAGQPCALPQRMQSMTRQGITVGFLDPQTFFGEGLTGIYLVDLAIKAFNPHGLLKQASVYSPDYKNKWRRVDSNPGGGYGYGGY